MPSTPCLHLNVTKIPGSRSSAPRQGRDDQHGASVPPEGNLLPDREPTSGLSATSVMRDLLN